MAFVGASAEAAFATNLRLARNAKGLTQATVAEAMSRAGFKWHPATVYKVEAGERQIQLGEALELARILGLGIEVMAAIEDETVKNRVSIEDAYNTLAGSALRLWTEFERYLTGATVLRVRMGETPDLDVLFPDEDLDRLRAVASDKSDLVQALKKAQNAFPFMWEQVTRSIPPGFRSKEGAGPELTMVGRITAEMAVGSENGPELQVIVEPSEPVSDQAETVVAPKGGKTHAET